MNGRKAKRIRAHSSTIFVEWFKTLVTEEEGQKINTKNYTNYMPSRHTLWLTVLCTATLIILSG